MVWHGRVVGNFTRLASVTIASALLAAMPIRAGGQTSPCNPCSLVMTQITELSSSAGAFATSLTPLVVRTANGGYVVSYAFGPAQLVAFSSEGKVARIYDREGRGPGELQSAPLIFMGRSDTLYAFDRARLLRFTSRLEHIDTRAIALPFRIGAVVLDNGSIVLDARYSEHRPGETRTADRPVFTLNILDASGKLIKSLEPQRDPVATTLLASSARGGFWVLDSGSSDLLYFTRLGQRQQSIRVRRDWFVPWNDSQAAGTDNLRPTNATFFELTSQVMVVITWVPDPNWKQPIRSAAGTVRLAERDNAAIWDSVIEAVDASTGAVRASMRVSGALARVQGSRNEVYAAREDADGHVVIDIWRIELR